MQLSEKFIEEVFGKGEIPKWAKRAEYHCEYYDDGTLSGIYPDPVSTGMSEDLVGYVWDYNYSLEKAYITWLEDRVGINQEDLITI